MGAHRGVVGVIEKARPGRSFHGADPAWWERVHCHVGQSGENVGVTKV
jgi:hypothetical protein